METINGIHNWWIYRLGPRQWEAREFLDGQAVDVHPFKRLKDAESWCRDRRMMVQRRMSNG